MRVKSDAKASELIESMRLTGVLGAGRVAKAADIIANMVRNPEFTVFLTLAGPVIPGGLRNIVTTLLRERMVNAIVSNGANITHDIIEALGFRHIRGDIPEDDVKLMRRGIGRIGDVYVDQEAFQTLEKKFHKFLERVSAEKPKQSIGGFEMLESVGTMLKDKKSILATASKTKIPIFCPGIYDSMLGLHLWTYNQLKRFKLDLTRDMDKMAEIVFNSKKLGVVILGGGLPKHFVLGASMLRGGVDAAVQVTMDRPEAGSLSGATLEEAVSWRKAKAGSHLATVVADFTIVFPLLVAFLKSQSCHAKEHKRGKKVISRSV